MATSMSMLMCCGRQISAKNKVFLKRVLPQIYVPHQLGSSDPQEVIVEGVAEKDALEKDEIDRIRNVSGLTERNRQRMVATAKMPEIKYAFQKTAKYQRRLYAKYGRESGINPSVMWPTLEELKELKEEEREWEPTLQEMWAKLEKSKRETQNAMREREALVEKNMSQMEKWIRQYHQKLEAKEEEVRKQQEKKTKLLDEAREFFGYEVDPRDAKFQEMVEEKELQRKKEAKAKKKQDQASKLAAQIRLMADQSREEAKNTSESENPPVTTDTQTQKTDTNTNQTLGTSKPEKTLVTEER